MKKDKYNYKDARWDNLFAIICLITAYVLESTWGVIGFALMSLYFFIKPLPWAIKILVRYCRTK